MSVKIISMPIEERKKYAGRHIITQVEPASAMAHRLPTGNGTMEIHSYGHPEGETMIIKREALMSPQWKNPPKAPQMADRLDMIRRKMLKGDYLGAAELADMAASQGGTAPNYQTNPQHPAMHLKIEQPVEVAENYIHTLDMRTGVIRLHWEENGEAYERQVFSSRADDAIVLRAIGPEGKVNIKLQGQFPELKYKRGTWESNHIEGGRSGWWDAVAEPPEVTIAHAENSIVLDGVYEYEKGGFATAVRVIVNGGTTVCNGEEIAVENANEVLLIIGCDICRDPNAGPQGAALLKKLEEKISVYDELLARHVAIHQPIFDRLSVDLGGDEEDYLLSTIELKQKQFTSQEIVPAYMEAMVDMGRFFLMRESGEFPPIHGHVNVNVNHQISGGNIGNLPEMMESFFRWIEWQLPDARENARRILGMRGFFIACHPDWETGNLIHFNEYFPHEYWISSTGWCLNPFLEHYFCTNDEDFMKNRALPLYKELAELYEDFLTVRDKDGNLMFIPSYSPENFPNNIPCMSVINATMDIQVCRETLVTLLTYGPQFGVGTEEDYARWQKMLDEMPPYKFGRYGELKEWAWDEFEERYDHRHASHLYGCYPGDEVQPDLTPELYEASFIANRMRALGNESCHGVMHRAQAAARLKDSWLLQKLIRFTMEAGYVTDGFTCVHNPYLKHEMPDGQGALPTALLESLLYSRPGVIEALPAVPEGSFKKGCLKGMASRSFAEIKELSWNMDEGWIHLEVLPLKDQEVQFNAPAGYKAEVTKLNLVKDEVAVIDFRK